jgi:hypothetical protein
VVRFQLSNKLYCGGMVRLDVQGAHETSPCVVVTLLVHRVETRALSLCGRGRPRSGKALTDDASSIPRRGAGIKVIGFGRVAGLLGLLTEIEKLSASAADHGDNRGGKADFPKPRIQATLIHGDTWESAKKFPAMERSSG